MRGERYALRAGEYLVSRASRRLPAGIREERHQEWLAELPVILHDRTAGPAPRRVLRMLSFAADTLRGTTLGSGAYRYQGAHAGEPADNVRTIVLLLLALLLLLFMAVAVLAYESWTVYQLIFGASLGSSLSLENSAGINSGIMLSGLSYLIRGRISRSSSAVESWLLASVSAQAGGLFLRALAGQLGWGHPLLFAIISYCGFAVFIGCLVMALQLARSASSRKHPVPHE